MGRAGRGRVSRVSGWQGARARTAGPAGAAGSHSLARHAVTEQPGVTHRAGRAGPRGLRLVRRGLRLVRRGLRLVRRGLRLVRRGAAGRTRARHGLGARHAVAAGHGLACHGLARHRLARYGLPRNRLARHGLAVSRRLPLAHVVAGRSGRARTVRCPAWTRRVHPGLVAGARRRGSGPARWQPVLASPAGWASGARPGLLELGRPEGARAGRGRRCAGFPGWAGRLASRGRDRPWARRSGRPGYTRSWGSPAAGRNARRRARLAGRARAAPGSAGGAASWRCPGTVASGLDRLDRPSWPTAKRTRTTRPNAIPAAITYSPIRARWAGGTGGCLVACRRTTLAAMRSAPAITVAAAATARKRTRRILLVAVAWERTGQRSHRGYRPASQMASCNHYDLSFGA